MRQRIWRRLVAAVVGAVALAASASAQNPTPAPPVAAPAVVAQPAPGPTVPSVPAALAATSVGPGAVVVPADGGCATGAPHGTAGRGFVMSAGGGYYGTNCSTGQPCNNGCGSLRSDAGFVLGSCKSFFAPCGPRPLGWGHKCGGPVGGTGPCGPFNPCVYDSYLNH